MSQVVDYLKYIREVVCSPGHFLKGAVSISLENQINWYYAWVLVTYLFIHFT